jgi:hypothetical protein
VLSPFALPKLRERERARARERESWRRAEAFGVAQGDGLFKHERIDGERTGQAGSSLATMSQTMSPVPGRGDEGSYDDTDATSIVAHVQSYLQSPRTLRVALVVGIFF